MSDLVVFFVLALVAGLAIAAKWIRQPYPIVFLAGGIVLALVPGVPTIQLAPDLVFLVFLPPLIFGDGYTTDFREFKRYIRPIASLAIGLVVVTSVSVAYVAHWLIGLPLDVGFVLGAILSPTDTVATEAIAEETGLPRRLQTILTGESLVNDATGLVIYKFAIAAVIVGTFSLGSAVLAFVWVAAGGITIGVLGGMALVRITRFLFDRNLTDDVIVVTISLVMPFLLYLAADRLGVSGVLAAAAGGIYAGRKGGGLHTADARIVAAGVWNTLFFVFNGVLFLLLGFQLRALFADLRIFPPLELAQYGLAIAATVIVVRVAWVFFVSWFRRLIDHGIDAREGPPSPLSWTFILGWAGMRGILSLAAAFAIPNTVALGAPFPARDLILFVTFAVIFVTLVGQGISLPWLIRLFGVSDVDDGDAPVARARVRTADAGLRRLEQLEASFASPAHWEVAGKLRSQYEAVLTHFTSHLDGSLDQADAAIHELHRRLSRETLDAERGALAEMRRIGEITDDVYRRLQYEIDLAESRLT